MQPFARNHGFAACLLLCITACGGQQTAPEPSGYFATFIEDDGTKKFQYTLDSPFAAPRNNASGLPARPAGHVSGSSGRGVSTGVSMSSSSAGGRGSTSQGRNLLEQINHDLDTQLSKSIEKTAYCRTGHRVKERVIEREIIFIRGQCEESASPEDLEKFPNE